MIHDMLEEGMRATSNMLAQRYAARPGPCISSHGSVSASEFCARSWLGYVGTRGDPY